MKPMSLRRSLSLVLVLAACGTSPLPEPEAPLFFVGVAKPAPTGSCRLSISYDGGMQRLGKMTSTVLGINKQLTGGACGFRGNVQCATETHAFHFGEVSLPVGTHRLDVGFQFAGDAWLYKHLFFSLEAGETIECREGLTRVRIRGEVPASLLASWNETKISFVLEGPSRSIAGSHSRWTSPPEGFSPRPGRLAPQVSVPAAASVR